MTAIQTESSEKYMGGHGEQEEHTKLPLKWILFESYKTDARGLEREADNLLPCAKLNFTLKVLEKLCADFYFILQTCQDKITFTSEST